MSCDIVLVGVGGQGVLTIADLLIRSAFEAGIPATYCPTKGMAQRGGFVKAEVRLGRRNMGPRIGEGQADLVVSMERSEALKGLRLLKPGETFLLYDHVWAPAGVMLGADPYPERAQVIEQIEIVSNKLIVLDPDELPTVDGSAVRPNIYVLGAMVGRTAVGDVLPAKQVESTIAARWPNAAGSNTTAFRFGLSAVDRT
jgi:indolepyruvate ferredoxin oxidoreductase beta subunit